MSLHHKGFGIVEQDIEHRCEAGGEYSATTAPQAGYYGKLSHSLATAYPQMLQPTTCTVLYTNNTKV